MTSSSFLKFVNSQIAWFKLVPCYLMLLHQQCDVCGGAGGATTTAADVVGLH
jgi:hypothetical protein